MMRTKVLPLFVIAMIALAGGATWVYTASNQEVAVTAESCCGCECCAAGTCEPGCCPCECFTENCCEKGLPCCEVGAICCEDANASCCPDGACCPNGACCVSEGKEAQVK